jgi:hypothetical protein
MIDNPFILLTPEAIHLRIVDQMAVLSTGTFNDSQREHLMTCSWFLGMVPFVLGMVLFLWFIRAADRVQKSCFTCRRGVVNMAD